ncbi:copper chaperone CopZ [Paenibacillus sp. URB8-2]|uniref:copper chaperone CopZ n=1 Tax=Paenibacillus sp. URB8-2 TaxID=2741301 RepID=UPI0015B7E48A|nr:copper chaperone CopZ [Paenibacillus sp. URB8-2]BCG60409.1 copper chaperone CopZ [Paenibacillus sp. URB8-2]
MTNAIFKVNGMSCNHCVHSIEGAVNKLPGVEWVKVSLAEGEVRVEFKDAGVTLENIKETIEDQGYNVL